MNRTFQRIEYSKDGGITWEGWALHSPEPDEEDRNPGTVEQVVRRLNKLKMYKDDHYIFRVGGPGLSH